MGILKDLKRKRLFRKIANSNYNEMLAILKKMNKRATIEYQFNKSLVFAIFKEDYSGTPEDIKSYNTKCLQKVAIIKKGKSIYDINKIYDTFDNSITLGMCLYETSRLDKYKEYELLVKNNNSDYIYILEKLMKEKDSSYLLINGFVYTISQYKYLGGINNESIIKCKPIN